MKRTFTKIAVLLIFLSLHAPARACSICGCGDPLASAGSAEILPGNFRLSLEAVYLTASAQAEDFASTESLRQVNLNTALSYSPGGNFILTAMLPVIGKYWNLTPPEGPD